MLAGKPPIAAQWPLKSFRDLLRLTTVQARGLIQVLPAYVLEAASGSLQLEIER